MAKQALAMQGGKHRKPKPIENTITMQIDTSAIHERKARTDRFQAKITMPTREKAQALGIAWTRKTLTGHSISPAMDDGSSTVTIYDILPEDKPWLEETANHIANQ